MYVKRAEAMTLKSVRRLLQVNDYLGIGAVVPLAANCLIWSSVYP